MEKLSALSHIEKLNEILPSDLKGKIITEPEKVNDFIHAGENVMNKNYLNLTLNETTEDKLKNIRLFLKLRNNEVAAQLAIGVLSDLIEEQRRGDEIIVRHKKDGGFWGKKEQDYRIDFKAEEEFEGEECDVV